MPPPPPSTPPTDPTPLTTPASDTLRARLLNPSNERRWLRLALGVWIGLAVGATVYCLHYLGSHTVSPVYWTAAKQWWASQEMYGSKEMTWAGRHGYLYFPQAVLVFTPFAYLPFAVAEVSWRIFSIAVLMWAMWRVCARYGSDRRMLWFGLSSPLAAPIFLLSASNGQANLLVMAAMTIGVLEVAGRRWWIATAWLMLGVALKPHAMVLVLLIAALNPPMLWRLGVGLVVLAAAPFVNPDWPYVLQQHVSFVQKLRVVTRPEAGENQDLVGLVWTFGVTLPERIWTLIRVAGAGVTLGLCVLARKWFTRDAFLLYTLAFAVLYIMLFNPRTEGPTHSMLGLLLALFTARELIVRPRPLAWALVAASIFMGVCHEIVKHRNACVLPMVDVWFAIYLVSHVVQRRPAFPATL